MDKGDVKMDSVWTVLTSPDFSDIGHLRLRSLTHLCSSGTLKRLNDRQALPLSRLRLN
jgi:hypothetical protein